MLDFKKYQIPSDSLKGKAIVITGAGSGIGREVAKCYSKFGADLILLSKSQDKLETLYDELTPNGNNVAIQPIDFSSVKEKDYIDIVKAIKEEYSEINGLVNNAGILGEKKSIEQFDYKTWTEVQRVNLDAGLFTFETSFTVDEKIKKQFNYFHLIRCGENWKGLLGSLFCK